jgi:SAM-dependent methyltransferase
VGPADTGAALTGVDIAQTGLDAASASAVALGVDAAFVLGSFDDLPLPDASADVVMSIDAFLFAPNKPTAISELARVIRPGGRLVMTSWDYHRQPEDRPPQVDDHRPLLATAFDLERYDETEDWLVRQRAATTGLLAQADQIAAEDGGDPDDLREGVAAMDRTFDDMLRRFFLVARRTDAAP